MEASPQAVMIWAQATVLCQEAMLLNAPSGSELAQACLETCIVGGVITCCCVCLALRACAELSRISTSVQKAVQLLPGECQCPRQAM